MDKASDYESGDCRFESCQDQVFYAFHFSVENIPNKENWRIEIKQTFKNVLIFYENIWLIGGSNPWPSRY